MRKRIFQLNKGKTCCHEKIRSTLGGKDKINVGGNKEEKHVNQRNGECIKTK